MCPSGTLLRRGHRPAAASLDLRPRQWGRWRLWYGKWAVHGRSVNCLSQLLQPKRHTSQPKMRKAADLRVDVVPAYEPPNALVWQYPGRSAVVLDDVGASRVVIRAMILNLLVRHLIRQSRTVFVAQFMAWVINDVETSVTDFFSLGRWSSGFC